ncbi:MAG: hypothetical protein QMD97_03260 [Candidatus Aenigmarchaeota archaeon]|nr:hypothetical protein [Candidatus Aenigmarchaeota archaeon]
MPKTGRIITLAAGIIIVLTGVFYSMAPHDIHVSSGLGMGFNHDVHTSLGVILVIIGAVIVYSSERAKQKVELQKKAKPKKR